VQTLPKSPALIRPVQRRRHRAATPCLQQTYPRHDVQSDLTWPSQGEPSHRAWAPGFKAWEQPFLRHNYRSPSGPSWPPASLPEIIVDLSSKDGETTLYGWYIPFAGEPLLSGSGNLPESPTSFPPRALGTPVALYSTLRCLQLLISPTLWSTIKDSHSSPDPGHPSILQIYQARPSPPVTLLHPVLSVEDTPPQPSLQHQLHHPAAC
jgi:hypothetical protein